MFKRKRNAFTLIELIATLVIMAIIALIVTPLVMNIIRKAKISARKRSVDAYGRSVELAIASYLMDNGYFPTNADLPNLQVEYSGSTVVCNVMSMKENGGLYLSECKVNNVDVKDSHAEDGWYHYGTRDLTNEEYVDMYGDALKSASLAYFNTNGNPVEDYTTLTLDYKGNLVACDVTVNYDGTIYMTKCKVNNVDVTSETEDGYYHYGEVKPYPIGYEISYNNVNYYVIKDTGSNVTLLKAEPLTVAEVNQYGAGHINRYTDSSVGTASDYNGYGSMAYYSSETCGYVNGGYVGSAGCTSNYEKSEVKYAVDAWASEKAPSASETRLITLEDLKSLGYSEACIQSGYCSKTDDVPTWVYNSNYWYWTMGPYNDSTANVWYVYIDGSLDYSNEDYGESIGVRPVITISKSVLQ